MAKANSKWRTGNPFRVSDDQRNKMHDGRWVRLNAGTTLSIDSNPIPKAIWVYREDQVTERTWVARRYESLGWHRGARVFARS